MTTFTPPDLAQDHHRRQWRPPNPYPGDGVGGGQTIFPGQSRERQQNDAAGFQDVLRPRILLDIKVGYLRSNIESNPIMVRTWLP